MISKKNLLSRMKHVMKMIFIGMAFFSLCSTLMLTPKEARSQIDKMDIKNETYLEGFHLVLADEGWILTNQGLYWTENGGEDWINITPPNLEQSIIQSVYFLDTQRGWIILTKADEDGNVSYSIARTFDSGNTWQVTTLSLFEPGDVNSFAGAVYLYFIDSDIGWLVIKRATSSNFNVGTLFKTTDGGNTWTQFSIPIGEPVYFVTSEIGWTAGGVAGNEFYRTEDGGQSWYAQKIVRPLLHNKIQRELYQLPKFANIREGVLPVITSDGKTTEVEFFVTDDSGQSWSFAKHLPVEREIGSRAIPLAIFDTKHWLMVVPNSNRLLRTSNRSETMTEISHDPMTAGITELDMVTPEVGWAKYESGSCAPVPRTDKNFTSPQAETSCTMETRFLKTYDGGQTWIELNLPQPDLSPANDVLMIPESLEDLVEWPVGEVRSLESTQNFLGQGFDKCEIATISQLQNWITNSPYRAVNLYIGGSCRSCSNSALTASYISQMSQQGWFFIPTWVGPQSACSAICSSLINNDTTTAYNQGVNEANAAIDAASNLGLTLADKSGTIIYYDLESYNTTNTACREAAKAFISGWTAQLHARGNQSGVYGSSCASAISDFASISNVPDAIWPAHWIYSSYNSNATVWNVACLSDGIWGNHQRIRQYAGGHNETWGGITLNIDCDVIDGVVAKESGPLEKTLVRVTNTDPVYWLQNGKLYWVTTADVINKMCPLPGWCIINIHDYPLNVFNPSNYPQGPRFISTAYESNGLLIRQINMTDVYKVQNGQLIHFSYEECQPINCWPDVIDVTEAIIDLFPTCTYSISPTSSPIIPYTGGTGSFSVTTQSGCSWTATSNCGWVTITSGSSGSGSGTVNYTVAANPGPNTRTCTITVTGTNFTGTHTVNQAAPSECIVNCATAENGRLNIVDTSGCGGSEVTVTIEINNAPNMVDSLGFEVTYNQNNCLTFINWQAGALTSGFDFFNCSTPSAGIVRCGGLDAGGGIPSGASGPVVELTFSIDTPDLDTPVEAVKLDLQALVDDLSGTEWSTSPGYVCCSGCECDVSGDDRCTPQDALCSFQVYLGICPTACGPCEDICCDVTGDGQCTPADALCRFQEYLGIPNPCFD